MSAAKSSRTPEELSRLASEIMSRKVQPAIRPEDINKYVAIDVDSGDFELDEDDYTAVMTLRARRPSADISLERVGWPATYLIRRSS